MNSDMDIQSPNSSINYTLAPGDRLLQCPYVQSHQILEKKFVTHLNKCRNNYRKMMKTKGNDYVKMATCRWNFCHQLPEIELQIHEETCPDAHQYLQELQQLKSINLGKNSDNFNGKSKLAPPSNRPRSQSPVVLSWDNYEIGDSEKNLTSSKNGNIGAGRRDSNDDDLNWHMAKNRHEESSAWSHSTSSASSYQDHGNGNGGVSRGNGEDSRPQSADSEQKLASKDPLKLNTSPWNKAKTSQPDAPAINGNSDTDIDNQFPTLESVLQPSSTNSAACRATRWSVLNKPEFLEGGSAWDNNDGNVVESSDEDDWEVYTNHAQAPSYDPKIKLQQENVLFMPRGLTKSERKAYREKARLKLNGTTERLTVHDDERHIPVGQDGWRD